MKRLWNVPVILLAAIICSCSTIEEDRDICPCWYTIDFTEVDRSVQNLHLWIYDENGKLLCRDSLENGAYGRYDVKLERGKAYCYVWGNFSDSTIIFGEPLKDAYFIKADSCSSDPLFHYSKVLQTGAEWGCDTVMLQKEFAILDFTLKGKLEYKEQLQIEIVQSVCGRYVYGGFVEGKSHIYAYPQHLDDDSSQFRLRMMRQSSLDGIVAIITALDGDERVVIREFPLGEWLDALGYDMNAKNLADIVVELDLAIGDVSIMVDNWQVVLPGKIEI